MIKKELLIYINSSFLYLLSFKQSYINKMYNIDKPREKYFY